MNPTEFSKEPPAKPLPKKPLSRRRRRLRLTLWILAGSAMVALCVGTFLYWRNRPALYRPDEQSAEITRSLARGLPPEAPTPRFHDATAAAGLQQFRNFFGQRTSQLPEDMGPGAAWGDYDNDGDDDLFLVSAGGSLAATPEQWFPCALYENLGNGQFRPVSSFPEIRILGLGAAWGDYDADGYLDLLVSGYNVLRLYHNEQGSGRFTRDSRLVERPGFWAGVSWGDYNRDRHLDFYVCGYVQYEVSESDRARTSMQVNTAVPYTLNPASYAAGTNLLFRNRGDGAFDEVATALGVHNPQGRSLGALWHDFDDDGWPDLYVANDVSDNVFHRNNRGQFQEISHAAWVADYRSAMGLTAGDWNRDGDDDLFITHWVAQENALYDNLYADFHSPRPTAAPPSTNQFGLRFMDVADMRGLGQIALPFVGFGCEFADFDADGWLDLFVLNGSTLELPGTPKQLKPEEPFLFWNRRGEHFHDLAPLSPVLQEKHVGRGAALADYDDDGDIDILNTHLGEGVQLLRNDMQRGHWLKLRLRSRSPDGRPIGFADGTKVIAHLGSITLRRTISSVSYLAQSTRELHFGLGTSNAVDRIEVHWAAGGIQWFTNLAANARYQLIEGDPIPKPLGAQPGPATASVAPVASAPAKPMDDRARVLEFWARHRAAMNALKVESNAVKAIALFRQALELNPHHEDALYYLAQCLAAQGDFPGALEQLEALTKLNPQSHRGFQQWGTLRAIAAQSMADLIAAEVSLEKAHAINPEETGALLVLGEIALLRGDTARADQRLAAACRTNPRAAGGFFLRGYLAWKRGDLTGATALLGETRQALGKEWQPKGTTAEGDVKQKQYAEATPLTRFWQGWDGQPDPAATYRDLDAFLARKLPATAVR